MITLPVSFNIDMFVGNLSVLGAVIVGIGLIFLTGSLVFRVIRMMGSLG